MYTIKKKIIASLLITIIVMTNLTIIGKGAGISAVPDEPGDRRAEKISGYPSGA